MYNVDNELTLNKGNSILANLINTSFNETPIKEIMEVENLLHLGNRSEFRQWLNT